MNCPGVVVMFLVEDLVLGGYYFEVGNRMKLERG